jgi:hypothetical protein
VVRRRQAEGPVQGRGQRADGRDQEDPAVGAGLQHVVCPGL